MEVPRMGMSVVPAWAAWREVVPLAMIRSTPEETNPLTMVAALADSPEAFCGSNSTVPPAAVTSSVSLSWKPWVASSRAACCICWQMPTV